MTIDALGAALSGLRVAQRGLDVTSSNISNANTDGYTRKVLPLESVVTSDGQVVGVRTGEIQRYIDASLLRDYRVQLSVESYYDTRQSMLSRIVQTQGATDQQSNIGARIGNLMSSFVSLSASPDSRASQSTVVDTAGVLAKSLNTYSAQLLSMRNEVQSSLISEVDTMNATLKSIADLNKRIQSLANVGKSTASLEDQRDKAIKGLAAQIDITYYTDGDGTLVVQTKKGQVLVDTEARTIATDRTNLTQNEAYPDGISGLVIKGIGLDGDIDLTTADPGGKIGALLDLRDKDIPSYMAQADELAYKMMVRFNDQGVRLFTDSTGTIPANDPAVYAGIAGTIQVNALVVNDPSLLQKGTSGSPINAGDNTNIMNVINYAFGRYKDASGTLNEPFVTTQQGYSRNISFDIIGDPNVSLEEYARSMMDGMAADLNETNATLETEQQYTQEIEKRVLDSSAVNSDEEMANLIELQKTYSANAKIISALDQLFRDLLNAV